MQRALTHCSSWASAFVMLSLILTLAATGPANIAAAADAAAATPLAHQYSWVVDHSTGQAFRVATNDRIGNYASMSPTGLSPATIKSAYNFSTSSTAGAGKTLAIVDAYDDPNAESDLNVFSQHYGLPACTTANGCFRKVDQNGGSNYPRSDSG